MALIPSGIASSVVCHVHSFPLAAETVPIGSPSAVRKMCIRDRMDTPRAALTQAVLEGVAFAIRDCVEIARAQGVKIKASTLCGGGAKSPLWREILANVLGIPLTLPQTEQGPEMCIRDRYRAWGSCSRGGWWAAQCSPCVHPGTGSGGIRPAIFPPPGSIPSGSGRSR